MAIANKTDKVEHIRLSEIHADYAWNARKCTIREEADGVVGRPIIEVSSGSGEDSTLDRSGLVKSMSEHGQETPCIVRKTPSTAKHKKPYELVAGFRRHDARLQVAEDRHEKEPTLRCEIRTLTDKEARSLNVRENTERDSLATPDLCVVACRLWDADKNLSEEEVESYMGIARSTVNTFHRIHEGVATKYVGEWRKMPIPGSAYSFLMAMIGKDKSIAKNSKEQEAAFAAYKSSKAPKGEKDGSESPSRGKDGWMAKCEAEARRIGLSLGRMSRDGHISLHGSDFFRANAKNLLGDLLKDKADEEQFDKMVAALEKGAEDGAEASQSEADRKAVEVNGLSVAEQTAKPEKPAKAKPSKAKGATAN